MFIGQGDLPRNKEEAGRGMSRLGMRLLYAILALLVAGSAVVGTAGYHAWREIEKRGDLTQLLQDSLNNRSAGVFVTVESTRLELRLSTAPVRLIAENIRFGAVDAALVLPESDFGFSIANLALGRTIPTEVEVAGLNLDIEHNSGGWRAGPSVALIAGLLEGSESLDGLEGAGNLEVIRNIRIVDARLRISEEVGAAGGEQIVIEPFTVTIKRGDGELKGRIVATNPEGGTARIDFTSDEDLTGIDLTATVAGLRVSEIYPYLGVDIPELGGLGEVEGVITFSVEERGLARISGDAVTLDGRIGIPGRGELEYDRAELAFSYGVDDDLLTISNLDIQAPAPVAERDSPPWRFLVSGEVRDFSTNTPKVLADIKSSNLPLEQLFALWPEKLEPRVRDLVRGSIQGGSIAALGIKATGAIDRGARVFRVDSVDMISEMRSMRLETSFASVDRLVGTLSSRLELSMASGGAIRHAAANLLLENAQLLPRESARLVDLKGIELRARLNGNSIVVERAAIDARHLGQMALEGRLEMGPERRARRVDLRVRAEQIDKTLLSELWPHNLQPRARQWVGENIEGGVINGLAVDAGFNFAQAGGVDTLRLEGNADVVGAKLHYLGTMPPVEGVDASIKFGEGALHADILKGMVEGLTIDGSRLVIRASEGDPEADLTLFAKGDFGDAIRLLDHTEIDVLSPAGIEPKAAAGKIDATMGMKWPIPGAGRSIKDAGGVDVTFSASAEGAMLDGLPYGTRLDNGVLDIVMAKDDLTISGRGDVEGAPTVLSLHRQADGQIEMELAVTKSENLTKWIGSHVPVAMEGGSAARISLEGNPNLRNLEMEAELDLDGASINFARLGIAKLQGEDAELSGFFRINKGRIVSASDIRMASDVLSASGNASFDENGRFLAAQFQDVAWPGNNISALTVERNAENTLRIDATATVVDLTPLRREESPGEGLSLEIELTAGRIILDRSVTLAGNVVLTTEESGLGEAEFFGGLILKDKPFMTEAKLNAEFGGGLDLMQGAGKIGGVEAFLSLSPGDGAGSLMEIRSGNAGQILKTLGVTEAIRSGELDMRITFDENQPGHSNIKFDLANFNVIDAPQVVRWMSVLSLPGLFSLLDGDGTNFREGYAHIEVFPDKQIIHQARAAGAAVGVDLVGLIHPREKRMEVSGTLVPLNLLTEILGKVPLVGELLTGLDKSGIFATQFTLTGPIDDPVGTVNRSSLAPGFIRDIFSPDWVRRERERLIPNGAPESGGG